MRGKGGKGLLVRWAGGVGLRAQAEGWAHQLLPPVPPRSSTEDTRAPYRPQWRMGAPRAWPLPQKTACGGRQAKLPPRHPSPLGGYSDGFRGAPFSLPGGVVLEMVLWDVGHVGQAGPGT